jgi:hypothetical protein
LPNPEAAILAKFLAQLTRSEVAIGYVHPTIRELEKIGITRLLIAAGGVDNGGCLAPLDFYMHAP